MIEWKQVSQVEFEFFYLLGTLHRFAVVFIRMTLGTESVCRLSWSLSDLDPLQAPHWSVRVRKADNPQCLLGKKIALVLVTLKLGHKKCCQSA